MNEAPTQPLVSPAFNGWKVYGWLYAFTIVRMLHRLVLDREAEIAWHIQEKRDVLDELRAEHKADAAELTAAHRETLEQTRRERDEEMLRLRTENTELLNRLLKRQSTEPMPVNGEKSNGHYEPPVRRELKPPIASHNAAARAVEDAAHRQRTAAEATRREAIRRDAEERKTA